MRQIIISILFFIISYSGLPQIQHVEVLIGKTDLEVTHYFDSLNSLKSNPYCKIKKDVSEDGDLILQNDLALSDQEYYTCFTIMTRFKRRYTIDICTMQIVLGSVDFAQSNLSFIKDNFQFVSEGRWEKPFGLNTHLKIIATFQRREGQFPTYKIVYDLQSVK